jgi:hypothetical protein
MAEVVGIVAGIRSILKTLTLTGIYLQKVGSASREAQEVTSLIQREESVVLQQHMQAYMHMLSMVQTAFIR